MSEPTRDQGDLVERWLAHRADPGSVPAAPGAAQAVEPPHDPPADPWAEPWAEPPPEPEPVLAVDDPPPAPAAHPDEPDRADPTNAALAHPVFRPRRLARTLTGVLLLCCLVGTGLLAWTTYRSAGQAPVLPLVLAGGLTLAVWAARATTTTAYLEVTGGVLVVTQAGRTWRADLTSPLTGIEVEGRPGRPGWRVRFGRPGEESYVVDAAMVDPRHFMRVLFHHRPDLAADAPDRGRRWAPWDSNPQPKD